MKLHDVKQVKTKEQLTRQILDPLCECSNEFKDNLTNIVFKAILLNEDDEFNKAEIEWMKFLVNILQDCTTLNEIIIAESNSNELKTISSSSKIIISKN